MADGPVIVSKPALLQPHRIEVKSVGDKVEFWVGNACLTMDYETALKVSQWLRVRGKESKRRAGDMSRHWSVIGVIEDLNTKK